MFKLLLAVLGSCLVLPQAHATADADENYRPPILTRYTNPILPGFNPDPSCINYQNTYYCVTSSFNAFPALPVYASRDLIQWRQIGNVISRPEQLPDLQQVGSVTGGVWAAALRFHDGTFYVTTTLVFDQLAPDDPKRWKNAIFTTKNLWANNGNGWSDPVYYDFEGYDGSLFWDDDGKVYLQASHSWRVFPAIQQFEIDLETGRRNTEPAIIWNGTGGLAPEGPHIYKRNDGWYYLLIAEGGTGVNHMVTMARARSIGGPYEPHPHNPVLTNANTTEYLQTVGHSDLFQDGEGNWWASALATRNGTVDFPMGRETVLVPVTWEHGEFPVFNGGDPGRAHVHMEGPLPHKQPPPQTPTQDIIVGSNQIIRFSPHTPLPRQLVYFRYPDFSSIYQTHYPIPNSLAILGSSDNVTGINAGFNTSTFISRRQEHVQFVSTVTLAFDPKNEGEEAGMTLFLTKKQHFDMGVVRMEGKDRMRLRVQTANATEGGLKDAISRPGVLELGDDGMGGRGGGRVLDLKVEAVNASWYEFSYRGHGNTHPRKWTTVGWGAARQVSGGFTGTVIGMFATGNGEKSKTVAYFTDFTYEGNDHVF